MITDLEQLRTFSILSESPQYIDNGNKEKYVTYAGYLLPYSAFSVIFMWVLCGPPIYQHIWSEQEDMFKVIKDLNTHDPALQNTTNGTLSYYLLDKFKQVLGNTTPEYLEIMLNQMFFCGRPSCID